MCGASWRQADLSCVMSEKVVKGETVTLIVVQRTVLKGLGRGWGVREDHL